jgi:methyl coenzyme M reductase subunit C
MNIICLIIKSIPYDSAGLKVWSRYGNRIEKNPLADVRVSAVHVEAVKGVIRVDVCLHNGFKEIIDLFHHS